MNKIILIVITIVVVAGGAYFFSRLYAPSGSNQGQTSGDIAITNFAFSPAVLNVAKGDTVVWVNQDSAPHQVSGNGFESGVFNQGQNFSFTFTVAGDYDYTCPIHPYMKGKVIVR